MDIISARSFLLLLPSLVGRFTWEIQWPLRLLVLDGLCVVVFFHLCFCIHILVVLLVSQLINDLTNWTTTTQQWTWSGGEEFLLHGSHLVWSGWVVDSNYCGADDDPRRIKRPSSSVSLEEDPEELRTIIIQQFLVFFEYYYYWVREWIKWSSMVFLNDLVINLSISAEIHL